MSSYWDPSDNSGWFNQEQPNQPPPNHNNYQWDFNSAHNQQQPVYDGNYGYSSGPSPDEGYPNWQTTQDAQYYPPPSISDSTSQYGGQMFIPANNPPQQRDYAKGFQGDDVLIEDERPLLEELGINFDHICQKTLAVLNPLKRPDADAVTDQVTKQEYSQMYNCLRMVCFSDLAGPLVFALMFGGSLLLHGKVQFGYIYGIGALGCLGMYFILNMMSAGGISFTCTVSVLGYCLLPMAMLSALAAVLSFKYKLRINLHKAQAMLPADPPAWCIVKDVLYLLAVCSTSTPAIPGRRLFFVFALILGIFSGMLLFPRQINDVMLNGESVLITGASQGLGEEIAYSYARRGASLVITARSEDNLKKVSQRCVQMGAPQVFIYPADMTKSRDIENLIQFSTSKLGKISHLVLNHASQSTPDWWTGSVANETSLRNMFEANFFAYQTMASKFLNEFGEIDGRILVISSVIGVLPMPFYIPYAATKHALQGFFGGLQHELYMKGSPRKITLALIGRTDTETQRTLTEGGNFVRHGRFPPAANVGETAEKLVRSSLNGEWVVYHPITSKYINILTNLPIIQPIFRRIIAYQMEKKGC